MSQDQEPSLGLTAEVMQKLEGGARPVARGRITNTFTYVLAGLAVLVGTFSAGAWVGRENAPAAATGTAGTALPTALPGASGASGGFAGRNGGAGFTGASGFTGVPGGGPAGGGVPGGAAGAGGTTGTVKLVDGDSVYITTAQGTTVKVTTNAQSTVNVSKQGTVADLAVGETIIVQGEAATDGTIAATTIRSGTAGLGGAVRGGGGAIPGGAPASGATGGR